jgi:alpha-beta hydrolase superfamily lysophospholipase
VVDVALSTKLHILLTHGCAPRGRVAVPIEPEMFTTTPRHLAYIRNDPLRLTEVTTRFMFESHRLEQYIDQVVPRNELPVLLFLAGQDRIIDNTAVVDVLERGRQDDLTIVEYADQTHSIQFDAPERLVRDMTHWLDRHGPRPQPPGE